MRKTAATWTLVSVVGLATPLAAAQDQGPAPTPAKPTQPEKAPKIRIDRTVHDFGTLFEDAGKQRTKFIFTNEGEGELRIQNVATTCGCTTPEMEKLVYAPGESGELVVYYDPHNRKGPQNRKVTIHSNDPASPRLPITIEANVKRMIEIEPAIIRLGQVPKGETRTMMVDVTGRAPGFEIAGTEVLRVDGLKVDILDAQQIEEDDGSSVTRYTLLVNLNEGQPIGPFQGALSINMADSGGNKSSKNVSIIGEILGDLKVSPRQFNVGAMDATSRMERHFSVISREHKPFKILRAEERPLMGIDNEPRPAAFQNMEFEAIPEDPENPHKYMIRFSFEPRPEIVRQFFTQVVFHTDRKDEPELVLRVLGRINNPVLIPPPAKENAGHGNGGEDG